MLPPVLSIEGTCGYFNRRHPIVFVMLKIRQFYSIATQQWQTIISTPVWLHVSVFSRQYSGQYFPVEGTFGALYTLLDPYCL